MVMRDFVVAPHIVPDIALIRFSRLLHLLVTYSVEVIIPGQMLIEDNSEKSSRFLCLNQSSVDMQLDV